MDDITHEKCAGSGGELAFAPDVHEVLEPEASEQNPHGESDGMRVSSSTPEEVRQEWEHEMDNFKEHGRQGTI